MNSNVIFIIWWWVHYFWLTTIIRFIEVFASNFWILFRVGQLISSSIKIKILLSSTSVFIIPTTSTDQILSPTHSLSLSFSHVGELSLSIRHINKVFCQVGRRTGAIIAETVYSPSRGNTCQLLLEEDQKFFHPVKWAVIIREKSRRWKKDDEIAALAKSVHSLPLLLLLFLRFLPPPSASESSFLRPSRWH